MMLRGPHAFLCALAAILGLKKVLTSSCSSPLGMASGEILDWQLSASSSYPPSWDAGCHVKYARLHQRNKQAWCSGNKREGEWLLVDLGVKANITGIVTQGRADGEEWVTKFLISYSSDAFHWEYVKDLYNDKKASVARGPYPQHWGTWDWKVYTASESRTTSLVYEPKALTAAAAVFYPLVFHGNMDSHTPRRNAIEPSISARFIQIHVVDWHSHPSLRIELLGCQECKTHISEGTQVGISASSFSPWKRGHSCQPYDSAINSGKAWCTRKKTGHQWIQFDLGPPHSVTGVISRGRGDTRRKQWVTAYKLTYSNDSRVWFTYKDGNHLDQKILGGNLDKQTERRHYLNSPFTARFVRINPIKWHNAIAMRVALLGCPHKGKCGHGFFKLTPESPCMENLAWMGKTWVNDVRHQWSDWIHGASTLAVDGSHETHLRSCAVVQNYQYEEPIWMVDLARKRMVNGVVLVTWQGEGEDELNLYQDYVFGVEEISVFVENRPRLNWLEASLQRECVTITRRSKAVFRKRIHVECPYEMEGRYIYIKAKGVANRQQRSFALVLCEVMVY